ncbi:FAD-dependent oxidoreductase [Neptunomonas antarctica]|uniref:Ferredoxin--NADP+ reductase n=1 Tax=Neptunomonas antarctica TaxID=619304 RepID=A0A1N7LNQ3_9GAMM|nr:FAD-dependent oxidoreductase [Neptunomonas antarctica]SIS75495.1 ferredoxin--NADP+ reductase [Neptunomonas antarctica]
MIQIAIIGSGPSGCYVADMLAKKLPDAQVDIFDKLPTPFGLVRAGVAPDHQHTKNITRQLERILLRDNVRFIGNVTIGTDISYFEFKRHYHIIVIAIGATLDRPLNITGDTLEGVYGSGEFSRWYNGHPEAAALNPTLSQNVAIIGNGNVSLDIARLLSKRSAKLLGTDITRQALEHIHHASIKEIYIIGRRGAADVSFTPAELQEITALPNVEIIIDSTQIPEVTPSHISDDKRRNTEKNLEILRQLHASNQQHVADENNIRIHFIFSATPIAITGTHNQVAQLLLTKNRREVTGITATNEQFTLGVGTVISAIGYRTASIPDIPYDHNKGTLAHHEGRVEPGVYAAGWCKRGPNGVIPANRADAMNIAKTIIAEWEHTVSPPYKDGFAAISTLLDKRNSKSVSYNDWYKIDQAEISRAQDGKPREKFTRISEMLALLDSR